MTCSGRYATAMDYATFLGLGHHVSGVESSGIATPHDVLEDDAATFLREDVQVGMPVRNITDHAIGRVTNVNERALTAHLAGGTHNRWCTGDVYEIITVSARETAVIEAFLDLAAPSIHAALGAVGACDCELAPWALGLLAKLNIVEAWVVHRCPCGSVQLSSDERNALFRWLDRQYELIRTGDVELCAGHTGAKTPAADWANHSLSIWNEARLILRSWG
jgi:hypothetical protein